MISFSELQERLDANSQLSAEGLETVTDMLDSGEPFAIFATSVPAEAVTLYKKTFGQNVCILSPDDYGAISTGDLQQIDENAHEIIDIAEAIDASLVLMMRISKD
jgi:hypothetical protein